MEIRRGQDLELDIESLAFGGRGIARVDGYVIFVDNALPGQQVHAKIVRKKKDYAEAKVQTVLKKSPSEIEARCRHFGECGGCRFQNLDYTEQLRHKKQQIADSLKRIGGFDSVDILDPLVSPDEFYYRNKMEYSFGRQRWITHSEIDADAIRKPKDFALGLHVRGRYDKILDVDECHLQSDTSVGILNEVKQFTRETGIPAYDTSDHTGFWRHLVIREGKHTGELMVNLVTAFDKKLNETVAALAQHLVDTFSRITTVVHTINRRKAQVAYGDERHVLFGPGYITEKIGDFVFQISPESFFQTNTAATELLYKKIAEFARPETSHRIYDLYCGAGAISIYLSKKAKQITGFEVIESAIEDARLNCQLNGIANCDFIAGDLKDTLRQHVNSGTEPAPDMVVIDPPRAGMHPDVIAELAKISPEKIVYVSCNPATFARDAKMLSGYQLRQVQPVDMFPMTPHIELVTFLTKTDASE